MNFENIFEKHNIKYSGPKRRKKTCQAPNKNNLYSNRGVLAQKNECSSKALSRSNTLQNVTENIKSSPSFCFNNRTKSKYSSPTCYKTLDLVRAKAFSKRLNFSKESSIFQESAEGNDFLDNEKKSNKNTLKDNLNNDCDLFKCNRNHLSCSFNLRKSKEKSKKNLHNNLRYTQLNISIKPKNERNKSYENNSVIKYSDNFPNDTIDSSGSSISLPSQIIDSPSTTQESVDESNLELDLLIDLIQREQKSDKKHINYKNSKCNSILTTSKSILKGGYEELFERALKSEKVKGTFLKHDRNIGLRSGTLLTIVNIQTLYGLTVAIVTTGELDANNFGIVVAQEMVPQLKIGNQIEAFFDYKSLPYELEIDGDYLDVYLEPYKLLLV